MASLQPNRNIPCMWDIFGKPSPRTDENYVVDDFQKLKLDNSSSCGDSNGNDSAISVGSVSDEDIYLHSNRNNGVNHGTGSGNKKKKRSGAGGRYKDVCSQSSTGGGGGGPALTAVEHEVKYLERHLSMKKTLRKKIMRDLQNAFVEDPNEFRVENIPPEQLKAEINLQSLSFAPAGKKKDKKNRESNFLDFLRAESGENKGQGGGNYGKNTKKSSSYCNNNKDADGDSGHGSPATEESEEEDKKTSFWKRFTMKGSRSKR